MWLILAFTGLAALAVYSGTPGKTVAAGPVWPAGSQLAHDKGRDNLVMFVHPWCSCSEASLTELESLLAHSQGRLSAQVVFLKPVDISEDKIQASLWYHAQRIPGVTVVQDEDGAEAARFHAGVSGDTFVFTRDGKLAFRGGITVARGHIGDNAGRASVEELVQKGAADVRQTPVYGCELFTPETGRTGS